MWHAIERIAKDMFLPEQELIVFAEANADKYSVDNKTKGDPWVGNWHCNDMIKDFRAQNPELCERVRAEKIKEFKLKRI